MNKITDRGAWRHYTIIPNIVFEMGLSPYALALYAHIKRIAGEDGDCWASSRALAAKSSMSLGKVSDAKRELERAGLIEIELVEGGQHGSYHNIEIVDLWDKNADHFRPKSPERSPHERMRSPHEQKNTEIIIQDSALARENCETPEIQPSPIQGEDKSTPPQQLQEDDMTENKPKWSDPTWDILHGLTPAAQPTPVTQFALEMREAVNRLPADVQGLAAAFQEASGIILQKEHAARDIKIAREMLAARVTPQNIKDAVADMRKSGLTISWLGSVKGNAVSLAGIALQRAKADEERKVREAEIAAANAKALEGRKPVPASERRKPVLKQGVWKNE